MTAPIVITACASSRVIEGGRAGGIRYSDYTQAIVDLSWDPDFRVEVDMDHDGQVKRWDRTGIPAWLHDAIETIALLAFSEDREVHTFTVEPAGDSADVTIQSDDAA